MNRSALSAAAALMLVPLAVGAGLFRARTPGTRPGVFVEIESLSVRSVHELPGTAHGADDVMPAVRREALLVPAGGPLGLFVVDDDPRVSQAHATSATLALIVVNNADPTWRSSPLPMTVSLRRVNSRVFEVKSEGLHQTWQAGSIAFDYYERVLRDAPGARSTMELLAMFETNGGDQLGATVHAVSLGPKAHVRVGGRP